MDKVKSVPTMRMNLFSLVVGRWKLESEGNRLLLSKDGHQILFNKQISMGESFVLCAEESVKDSLNVLSERRQMHQKKLPSKLRNALELNCWSLEVM
jgi:hypothetical protein